MYKRPQLHNLTYRGTAGLNAKNEVQGERSGCSMFSKGSDCRVFQGAGIVLPDICMQAPREKSASVSSSDKIRKGHLPNSYHVRYHEDAMFG